MYRVHIIAFMAYMSLSVLHLGIHAEARSGQGLRSLAGERPLQQGIYGVLD